MALCEICQTDFKVKSKRQSTKVCGVCLDKLEHGGFAQGDGNEGVADEGRPLLLSGQVTHNVGGTHLKFLCWPDTHFPYGDPRAINLGLQVVRHYQPDVVFLMGDMLDCTGFGSYKYRLTDPKSFLVNELNDWYEFADRLRAIVPKAELVYIEGNHEQRVERWVGQHPQLTDLPAMNLDILLKLGEYGFANNGQMVQESYLANEEVVFTHGIHTGSNKAGFAARFEMARYGISGFTGHTHRLAQYFERSKRTLRTWFECGHMQQWRPHYLKSFPNWQQGLAIGEAARDGNDFYGEAVPFRTTYKCRVGGKEFAA